MSNINFNSKINLPKVGEIDLRDYHIKSIEVLSDADTYYFDGLVGKTVSYNHRVIIKNDYFEFEILYYENRNDKEILYLFDIFKQLTKYEIDFWHYRELQEVIEDNKYVYKYDEEWIDYNYKKWKIYEEITDILRHLQDEFYIENNIEFNKEYSSEKITIGLQKMS